MITFSSMKQSEIRFFFFSFGFLSLLSFCRSSSCQIEGILCRAAAKLWAVCVVVVLAELPGLLEKVTEVHRRSSVVWSSEGHSGASCDTFKRSQTVPADGNLLKVLLIYFLSSHCRLCSARPEEPGANQTSREVSLAPLTQVLCDTEVIMRLVLEPRATLLCSQRHLLVRVAQ